MSFKSMRDNKYFELLSTGNKKILDQWKMHSGVQKEYDVQSKTYVYKVTGESPMVQMYFPKNKKQKLDLHYPLVVLQLSFPFKGNILCNIGITSTNSLRKRITLSSNQKCQQNSSLFTVLPFTAERSDKWINVLVDIEEILSDVWKDLKLKGIDFLSLSGIFSLKRIFLISRDLMQNREGILTVSYDKLPRQMSQPKAMMQHYQYISSAYSSLVESLEYDSSETSETSSKRSVSRASSSKTLSNSSRSCSSSTLSILSSTSEVGRLDQNIVTSYLSTLNNSENHESHFTENHEKNFDLDLSTLTFSEEMVPKMQLSDSNEVITEDKESDSE